MKKVMRRGHMHRRSGSVTIKRLEEAKITELELPPMIEASPSTSELLKLTFSEETLFSVGSLGNIYYLLNQHF